MAFKIADLKKKLKEISNDGYKKVEITVTEAEDDLPGAVWFSALELDGSLIDYEEVEECESSL